MTDFPNLRTVGLSGVLISFADALSGPANRAALAFRAAIEQEDWPDLRETSMSLVSVYLVVDLVDANLDALTRRIEALLATTDWYAAALPQGRTLWHIPTVYGTDLAPQLEEAAALAGLDADEAIRQLSTSRVRVLTIGFAPGQPYMGELDAIWDIPRQQGLTKSVPSGALVCAIRQLIVFTTPAPTGWRHVGQTAFRTFRPDAVHPFALKPGDELVFPQVCRSELERHIAANETGDGGAEKETLS
ncbi:MAG: allophanate hydrolase subunit 1 [Roseobacter sp.]